MYKILYIILISFIVSNCSFKPVVKHHGVPFLEKKQLELTVDESNKNEIRKILGNPSTTSKFDNDVWIYVERKFTTGSIFLLGKEKILANNVLVVEIDDMGLLSDMSFYDKNSMKDIKISEGETGAVYSKRSFVYDFLSSMRQKINNPTRSKK